MKHLRLREDMLKHNKTTAENVHQVSLQAQVAAQTAYKYLTTPQDVRAVDLEVLAALLVKGMGMTERDVLDLKLGDVFAFVKEDPAS